MVRWGNIASWKSNFLRCEIFRKGFLEMKLQNAAVNTAMKKYKPIFKKLKNLHIVKRVLGEHER